MTTPSTPTSTMKEAALPITPDLHLVWNTLMFFAHPDSYTKGERTGGVLQGCPRAAPPTPEAMAGYAKTALAALCRAVGREAEEWMTGSPVEAQPCAVAGEAQKYDEVLLPFLTLMRRELHANSSKGDRPGWLLMHPNTALLEVYWHAAKLSAAVKNNDGPAIMEHGADVANMAMMVLDVCGSLAFVDAAPVETEQPAFYAFKHNHGHGKFGWTFHTPEEYPTAYRDTCLEIVPLYARPTPAAGVPPGFVMVPSEPTPAMLKAGGHANSEWLNDNAPIGEARYASPMESVWRDMLAARPLPGGVPTGLSDEQIDKLIDRFYGCDPRSLKAELLREFAGALLALPPCDGSGK